MHQEAEVRIRPEALEALQAQRSLAEADEAAETPAVAAPKDEDE
jgi:hypothetical protein